MTRADRDDFPYSARDVISFKTFYRVKTNISFSYDIDIEYIKDIFNIFKRILIVGLQEK